jgi:hypothetical protein
VVPRQVLLKARSVLKQYRRPIPAIRKNLEQTINKRIGLTLGDTFVTKGGKLRTW